MTRSLIEIDDVSKRYGGVQAVSNVSIRADEGECLAVIGPNGAGKSTLFGMIAGEHPPTSGTVTFAGRNVTSWPSSKRALHGMSRTFQVARMFASYSVFDNVMVAVAASRGRGMRWRDRLRDDQEVAETASDILVRTRLVDVHDQEAGTLAQGDRKRLELAMALAQRPKALLLDEPTAGMSYEDAIGTIGLLQEVRAEHPTLTVVLTAHDMEVIFALADRVVLMAQGRAEVEGTPDEVAAHPKTQAVYLGRAEA